MVEAETPADNVSTTLISMAAHAAGYKPVMRRSKISNICFCHNDAMTATAMSELMKKIEHVVQSPFFDQTGRSGRTSSHCRILKLLFNGTYSFDCAYREIGTKQKGIDLTPEEAAHAFLELHRQGRYSPGRYQPQHGTDY